jgi:hypothetical protein
MRNSSVNCLAIGVTWLPNLSALGYVDPLLVPLLAVQATIASIVGLEIFELV